MDGAKEEKIETSLDKRPQRSETKHRKKLSTLNSENRAKNCVTGKDNNHTEFLLIKIEISLSFG